MRNTKAYHDPEIQLLLENFVAKSMSTKCEREYMQSIDRAMTHSLFT